MQKNTVSGLLSTLLLLSMLTLAFNVQPVKADYTWSETIYIHGDGSTEPVGVPISTVDKVTYTLTDNIVNAAPSHDDVAVIIERDNIILDGAGYTLQGMDTYSKGIALSGRSNVTVQNMNIRNFYSGVSLSYSSDSTVSGNTMTNSDYGVRLDESSHNTVSGNTIANNWCGVRFDESSNFGTVSGNNITNNDYFGVWFRKSSVSTVSTNTITNHIYHGIWLEYSSDFSIVSGNTITNSGYGVGLYHSSHSTVSGNTITDNDDFGVYLYYDSNNTVSGNTMANSEYGVFLYHSSDSTVSGNTITDNESGVGLRGASDNRIHHNNFINNTQQTHFLVSGYGNFWDDGYPSGGNYWSDHVTVDDYSGINQDELGSDGIVDEPYIIDSNNRDHYPLVEPWSPAISATVDIAPDTLHLVSQGQWITCYIELPEGYDVSDIDVSTVMLNATIPVSLLDVPAPDPVPTEIGDYDNDTIPDLMVKFNRTLVSAFILSQRITNGVVTLTITGDVNGSPFEGADTIRVVMGGGGTGRRK